MKATVKGTGDRDLDTKNLSEAVDYLNSLEGDTTLYLENDIYWTKKYNLTSNLIRLDQGIDYNETHVALCWNSHINFKHALTPFVGEKGNDYIENCPLERGDTVMLVSDDEITDVQPHQDGQRPLEVHTVHGTVNGKTYLKDLLCENFTINPRLYVLPKKRIVIEGLNVEQNKPQKKYSTFIQMRGLTNAEVNKVTYRTLGPGSLHAIFCSQLRINDLTIDGTERDDGVYGIVLAGTNGVIIDRALLSGCRHVFTTTSSGSLGRIRYGSILNTRFQNSIVYIPTTDFSRVGVDTHSEENGTVFANNTVVGGAHVYAMQSRGKNTTFSGNNIKCGEWGYGIRAYGHSMKLLSNTIEARIGIELKKLTDRCTVKGNTLDCKIGIGVDTGEYVYITNNTLRSSSYAIRFFNATGQIVHNNGNGRILLSNSNALVENNSGLVLI